jgi:hypothetical protein
MLNKSSPIQQLFETSAEMSMDYDANIGVGLILCKDGRVIVKCTPCKASELVYTLELVKMVTLNETSDTATNPPEEEDDDPDTFH